MPLYRLTLRLTSPLGTPLAGPSLFGQLCWIKRDREGRAALDDWLADPARLWRISDGFPHGHLPKPLCHPQALPTEIDNDHKDRKKRIFIRREVWLANRTSWREDRLPLKEMAEDPQLARRLAHNAVDRHGRGTLDEGGLFFLDEDWRFAAEEEWRQKVDLYVEAEVAIDEVLDVFTALGEAGFGRDASTGRGRWRVEACIPDGKIASGPGDRRMTLTRGVLTPESMHDALWQVEPHFGRTGPQLALSGVSPFKYPVLLIRPGATFNPHGPGPFGRWFTGVHPSRPEIGLNGLHIAIPFAEA